MDWITSIQEIQKARDSNRLVIFVGAGVSVNSNLPSWKDLVQKVADEIGYDKCANCKKITEDCKKRKCDFTQEELLRIPEYYYQNDSSHDKQNYFKLLKSVLQCDNGPNAIDEEIFRVLPHHVITTNYDSLLEDTQNVNTQLYNIVAQDKDLLSQASDRYIIKMHGDLKQPKTIVLTESDYLDYEQKHPLLSTFIRSLLVNHTFLFLGYSLNDYNLNLIIGWINYFCKTHDVKERVKSFLLSSEKPSEFEEARLKNKSIYVAAATDLPDEFKAEIKIPESLTHPAGRNVFCYLRCISDLTILRKFISLADSMTEKYAVLKPYRRISYEDIIRILPLGRTQHLGTELVFCESKWYEEVKKLLEMRHPVLIETFQKAGITAIHNYDENTKKEIALTFKSEGSAFKLYLQNNYSELLTLLSECDDTSQKIYYYTLMKNNKKAVHSFLVQQEIETVKSEYITVLLHKMRKRIISAVNFDYNENEKKEWTQIYETIPVNYREAAGFLASMFSNFCQSIPHMKKLLLDQEEKYAYHSNKYGVGSHAYIYLWELQGYAYDYYFFFKGNFLPCDELTETREYLSYYLQALLCSYSPLPPKREGMFGDNHAGRKHYALSEIEVDMLVKYVKPKSLQSWISKYAVTFLEIGPNIEMATLYENLLKSYVCFGNAFWIDQIYCFSILICLIRLDNNDKKHIFNVITATIKENPTTGMLLFESIEYLMRNLLVDEADEEKTQLINTILAENVYPAIEKRYEFSFAAILRKFAPLVKEEVANSIAVRIDALEDASEKCKEIFLFRDVLPMQRYTEYLISNISTLHTYAIIKLVAEKTIPFQKDIIQGFINTIEKEDERIKRQPGFRSSPDYLANAIEGCLLFMLIGYDVDINLLNLYSQHSDCLQFVLSPDTFDYSKVDTDNYMWNNFIYSDKYQKYFIQHRDEILCEPFKNILALGQASVNQQKIVFGILLSKEELQKF